MSTPRFLIQVRGDGLAALAAALRLARLGHRVQLVSPEPTWRPASDHPLAAVLPPVMELPAAWKDLFAKTGRSMDAELAGLGLELVEAPPVVHRLAEDSLRLPTERAGQLAAVREHYGPSAADAWRGVLDTADEAWRARRRFGLERPVTVTPRRRDLPGPLADRRGLARSRGLPRLLDAVVVDLGAECGGAVAGTGAGLLVANLAVPRVFGRWHLLGPEGPTTLQPLLDLLDRRLEVRGVELLGRPGGSPDAVVETGEASPPRRTRPFLAPAVTLTRTRSVGSTEGVEHDVEHTDSGPVGRWCWREGEDLFQLVHDHTRPVPAPRLGPAVTSAAAWRRRRPLRWEECGDGPATLMAGPASHGGPEPWAQLLTGALAAYRVHHRLTGVDASPRNRAIGADGRPRPHLPPHLSA